MFVEFTSASSGNPLHIKPSVVAYIGKSKKNSQTYIRLLDSYEVYVTDTVTEAVRKIDEAEK